MELRCLSFHVCPIRNIDGTSCQKRSLVAFAFVVEAEAAFDGSVRLVQLTRHGHCFLQLGIVFRVEVFAVGNELRDFPTAARILENESVVKPKRSRGFESGFLRCAVDEQLCSYAGVAIYPFAIIGGEMAAEVRESLLEWIDVVNFRLITAENRNDVVEDLGIKVLEKERVEIS